MTRDEFKLQRLKDDATMIRRTYPIFVACVIAFIVLSIYAFVAGKAPAGIGGTLIMASIALSLPSMKRRIESSDEAIREYEAYIADPSAPLSDSTEEAIAASDYPTSELLKGWIGLAFITFLLFAMGVFFWFLSEGEQVWLIVLGTGSIIGGIIMCFPVMRLFRSWRTSKALDEAGL